MSRPSPALWQSVHMLGSLLLACATDKLPADRPGGDSGAETGEPAEEARIWEDPRCAEVEAALQADLERGGAPGGAAAVWAGGALSCAFGLGARGPEDARPADAHTLFRAGQLTRALSAIALTRHAVDEPAGVDTPVTKLLPGFRFARDEDWAPALRLADALQSRTAFVDVVELAADPSDEALSTYLLDVYPSSRWLLTEPGEIWNPSVPGDALAGLLVEYGAGMRYREALAARVLTPLGMERTLFLGEEVAATDNAASAWTEDWSGASDEPRLADATAYDNGWARPSAYAWTSAGDLGLLLGFLLEGDPAVLEDDAREGLWAGSIDTGLYLGRLRYGYGLYRYQGYALEGAWHRGWAVGVDGAIPGFSAELLLAPDEGVGVAVLGAADGLDLDATLRAALGAFEGLAPEGEAPDPELDPADWEELTGAWLDPWSYGVLELSLADDTLSVSIPLLDLAGIPYDPVLTPVCRDNFLLTLDGEPLALSFLRPSEREPPDRLRTRAFVATRATSLHAFAPLPSPPLLPAGREPALSLWRRAGAR